jgi:hypothetical protein
MAFIAYYLTLLVITSYAIASKRRFERYVGGMLILNSLLATTLQRVLHDFYPLVAIAVIDGLLLWGLGWIVWRYRRPWIVIICALQTTVVFFDLAQIGLHLLPAKLYANVMAAFSYAQVVVLGAGVLWRTYGSPSEPPEIQPAAPPAGAPPVH